jgi:hypothetical protein
MSEMKTYFLFDSETGFILSGFDCCVDKQEDGYNLFTRPYKYPEYHAKDEKCRMDTIYNDALAGGLKTLKRENLKVGVVDRYGFGLKQEFVKNPNYLYDKYNTRGWWKIMEAVETL